MRHNCRSRSPDRSCPELTGEFIPWLCYLGMKHWQSNWCRCHSEQHAGSTSANKLKTSTQPNTKHINTAISALIHRRASPPWASAAHTGCGAPMRHWATSAHFRDLANGDLDSLGASFQSWLTYFVLRQASDVDLLLDATVHYLVGQRDCLDRTGGVLPLFFHLRNYSGFHHDGFIFWQARRLDLSGSDMI